MPRTAKKMQPPAAPQDQGYGMRGEQIAAQQQMGIPDAQAPAVDPAIGGPLPPDQAPQPGSTGNVTSPEQLLAMLQSQAPPPEGGLARPTDRPEEPVTQGLGQPMAPPSVNRAADTLEAIASTTGDQRFAALAQRARSI